MKNWEINKEKLRNLPYKDSFLFNSIKIERHIYVKSNIKNINLRMSNSGTIKISIPNKITNSGLDFINNSQEKMLTKYESKWIKRKLDYYSDKKFIFINGTKYSLDLNVNSNIKKSTIKISNEFLVINTSSISKVDDLIFKFIKKNFIEKWTGIFNDTLLLMKGKVDSLKIKKLNGSWGLYNSKKNSISLNYKLFFFNDNVINYVLIHEIAHFFQQNHSKKFWEIVKKYEPNYTKHNKELREYAE